MIMKWILVFPLFAFSVFCQDEITADSFLSQENLRRVNEFSNDDINRGKRFINIKAEFNPNHYDGEVIVEPIDDPSFKKNVSKNLSNDIKV